MENRERRRCIVCGGEATDKIVCQPCIDENRVAYTDLSENLPTPPKAENPDQIKMRYSDDRKPTLKEMQEFVGGYIELVHLRDGRQMIVNEEGRIHNLPLNPEASALYGGHIAGPAWVLKGNAKLD